MSNTIYHWHHIVPKHAGGTDHPSNLIQLSIEDHAEAHRKLYEEYGRWQDKCAWLALSKQISGAEATKIAQIEANRGKKYGRKLQAAIENARKGTIARTGMKDTDETKAKRNGSLSIYWTGRKRPNRLKKIICDGVEYTGIGEAVEKLGISYYILTSRLKSDDWKTWYYVESA
jgi:hypothetical protein